LQQLLQLSQNPEQQQYIQAKLAATLVYSGNAAAIFAADSPVTNLRFRSRVLKTQASPELLRQQAANGPIMKNVLSLCIRCWCGISRKPFQRLAERQKARHRHYPAGN
jgi:hypothetical protein